jgi:hypothetical protein
MTRDYRLRMGGCAASRISATRALRFLPSLIVRAVRRSVCSRLRVMRRVSATSPPGTGSPSLPMAALCRSGVAKAPQNRGFDRANVSLGCMVAESERLKGSHAGLGDHPCLHSAMRPRCRVHKEGVTNINVASIVHGQDLLTLKC